ncbi:hypothetical protein [Modestobacter sp. VKM Ac-2984]|uniref:hypothetical protein n=1 Tax=Modestobacter sp. VKM Ac-2984 TaxID=3004138 RepID=UPI0022AA64F4|nr:hypothetical protein [Modestobacter sp. VKM Ac-2984]MCZ2817270.1 hypothetical protein [Modestobacter sp. VKM Ac-2984]
MSSAQINRLLLMVGVPIMYIVVFLWFGFTALWGMFVVLALVGSGVLLFLRYRPPARTSVTLRGVDQAYALATTVHALQVLDDDRFGFPSGSFIVGDGTEPGSLLAKEYVPPARGFRTFMALISLPWRLTAPVTRLLVRIGGDAAGWVLIAAQILRLWVALMIASFMLVPIVLASVLEIILKPLVASVIAVESEAVGTDVTLHFAFQGPTAIAVQSRLLRSFEAAALPERFARTLTSSAA